MSKISNKLIELKLREVLQLKADDDISKFDDNTALHVIFAEYEDRIEFTESALERVTQEIQELKLAQVQLRNQLKYVKQKQSRFNSQREHFLSSLKLRQDSERLRRTLQQQYELFQACRKSEEELQKKIYDLVQKLGAKQKQYEDTRIQLESEKQKEKDYLEEIDRAKRQLRATRIEYEKDEQKYKNGFVQDLKKTLKAASDKQIQENQKLANNLQKKLNDQQKALKQVITTVNRLFRLNQPGQDQVNVWLAELQSKFESYDVEVGKYTAQSLKTSKNPIKLLAERQKKRIQGREFLLANYMNN